MTVKRQLSLFAAALFLILLASLHVAPIWGAVDSGNPERREASNLILTSSAFPDGGMIPSKYTSQGDDISPPLQWFDTPEGTKSLVLIMDDPDAPDPAKPKITWVHWVVVNISPSVSDSTISEGLSSVDSLGDNAIEGKNSWKTIGYRGPAPPIGKHRYFFKLYALDTFLDVDENSSPTKKEVESAMEGHVLGKAEIIGFYEKQDDLTRS